MNERIKELAEAAYRDAACNDTIGDTVSREAVDQKFAELIIRECANIAMREDHDPAECIKKHFGVEE